MRRKKIKEGYSANILSYFSNFESGVCKCCSPFGPNLAFPDSLFQASHTMYFAFQHLLTSISYCGLQYYAVQCRSVQYSTVQRSTVFCNAVQDSTVQCSAVNYFAVPGSTIPCSAVQYCARQYSIVDAPGQRGWNSTPL